MLFFLFALIHIGGIVCGFHSQMFLFCLSLFFFVCCIVFLAVEEDEEKEEFKSAPGKASKKKKAKKSSDTKGTDTKAKEAEKEEAEKKEAMKGLKNVRFVHYKASPDNKYNCLVFSQIQVFDETNTLIVSKKCKPEKTNDISEKEWADQYGCARALDGDAKARHQGSGFLGCAENTFIYDLEKDVHVSKVHIHGTIIGDIGDRSGGTLSFYDTNNKLLTLHNGSTEFKVAPKGKLQEFNLKKTGFL